MVLVQPLDPSREPSVRNRPVQMQRQEKNILEKICKKIANVSVKLIGLGAFEIRSKCVFQFYGWC